MSQSKILVVDDQPVNIQLLRRKFEKEGIAVVAAYTGEEALRKVTEEKPDLILLDVMMPDMDGLDVCEAIHENAATRSIPIIFITARSTKEAKIEGLAVGAVDYITKPIDLDETLARVLTQLRFVSINRENIDLQRRLEESRRSATIGAVTHGIAHNLNNLLGVVLGYLDLIKVQANKPDSVRANAESLERAVQRIVTIVKQLTSLAAKSRPPMLGFPLQQLLENSIRRYKTEYKVEENVIVTNRLGDLSIETHIEIFEDVLSKILINAWESYGLRRPASERVVEISIDEIELHSGAKAVEIRVLDRGLGIHPSVRDTLFEPFVSTKETVGVGMGLTIARHALRNMGGEISVADRQGGGTSVILTHPIEKRTRPISS